MKSLGFVGLLSAIASIAGAQQLPGSKDFAAHGTPVRMSHGERSMYAGFNFGGDKYAPAPEPMTADELAHCSHLRIAQQVNHRRRRETRSNCRAAGMSKKETRECCKGKLRVSTQLGSEPSILEAMVKDRFEALSPKEAA